MNIVLIPKCLTPDKNGSIQCLGHTAEGYVLPCCWLANSKTKNLVKFGLVKEKLKISNNESIIDIIQSQEWLDFYRLLRTGDSEELPDTCHIMCDENSIGDIYGQ